MRKEKIILFLVVPLFINLLLMGLYYSGIKGAQQLVAPTIEWLSSNSWREFGMVEQLQNIYLFAIIVIFVVAVVKRKIMFEKAFFLSGTLVMLVLFLEEIDYGIHFYEWFTGQASSIEVRNWHNQETYGKQNVTYLKRIVDLIMIIWFVLLPIFAHKIKYLPLKSIIPSCWFIVGFIVAFASSSFAHYLEGMGFDYINGVQGNLAGNISEFREANTYYLYLLYAIQLVNTNFNALNDSMTKCSR